MGKQVYNYTALLNNFSENMKKRRVELSLSQKELASIVGVSVRTIQNYENKKTIPTSAVMESISIALDMGLEKMIDDNKNNNKIPLADILEKIENNSKYEFILEDLNITNKLFDIIDLKKRRTMNILPENVLNDTLGGKLDISYDEKYDLVHAKLQQELDFEIKKLENKLLSKYEDIKQVFRPVNVATGDTVDKKKY
ncbi:helix-turn-helix domain-containing protein [Gemella sanguinis]|jgi:DNA-binding helix-turn-helix protein|uniref:helix-turn-helix domain-containing protein n=1 Tax=Gemella sanguinis TaxID=84135 RepID=UPI0028E1DF04|nr:helix-turn-helix domain-containing protein [Gemella sanguinis]